MWSQHRRGESKTLQQEKSGIERTMGSRGKAPQLLLLGLVGALALVCSKEQQKLRIRATKKTHGGDRLFLTARFLSSLIRLKPK